MRPVVPYVRESEFALRKPWRFPERRLLDYLLVYIQDGSCLFWVDHREYRFQAGQFCLVQPGSLVVLEGLTDTNTPFIHFDIFYNTERERSFPTRAGQVDLTAYQELLQPRLDDVYGIEVPVNIEPLQPTKFRETFLQIIELCLQQDPVLQLKNQVLVTELIVSLLETYYAPIRGTRQTVQTFDWITSYFSLNLSEPLTLQDMAGRANLSVSRFSATFKKRYGMSPHQYLLHMRVNHAMELLRNTELNQEEIASYCGFADLHHFSKTFKKRSGYSPGQWKSSSSRQLT
ncbi:AraC family transcriptional regulator [Paenibacillus oenotherae]|uniref:AraC family transcriptional regulator n=2 Tax=Paenibacillus oenotherae TaxID=1435645 RepID=A0ABS7D6C9_9BACL|nr:AraC family transcriptional regulator [Paenibacillus oenotherae]